MDYLLTTKECESREEIFDPRMTNKYNTDFMLDNWSPDGSMDLLDSIFDSELLNFNEIDDNLSTQIKIEPEEFGLNTHNNINNITNNNALALNNKNLSNINLIENVPSSTCVTESQIISSNSSDSGLSSDNLEMDISPEYEPFSPAVSSPGPSISERGEKNSPPRKYNDSLSSSPSYQHEHFINMPITENHMIIKEAENIEKKPIKLMLTSSPTSSTAASSSSSSLALLQQQQQQPQTQKQKVIVQKVPQIINLPTKRVLNQSYDNTKFKEKDIKIVKLSPQQSLFNVSNGKKVTIQMKNSNTGSKVQSKSGTLLINNRGKVTEVKKLIPLQTTTSNPRSILLPVTVQDMKGLKAYKVLNMSALKSYSNGNKNNSTNNNISIIKSPALDNTKVIRAKSKVMGEQLTSETLSDVESLTFDDDNNKMNVNDASYMDIEDFIEECEDYEEDEEFEEIEEKTADDSDSPYPKLILSVEEKRLLAKEGITLPSHYPLTKYEERELKRIRRKIRNKISAQDSRKRKKEYVDGLEERVKQCTEENQTLMKKIKLLQTQNQNLMSQMKKLQGLLSKGTNKTAHPTTCLLVLLLSLALVATPNLKFGQNAKENELNEFAQEAADAVLQNRRSLLFDAKDYQNNNNNNAANAGTTAADIFDEELNVNDFISMNEAAAMMMMNGGGGGGGVSAALNEFIMNNCKKMMSDSNTSSTIEQPPACKKAKNFIDFDVDDLNWYQAQDEQQQQIQQPSSQKSIYDLAAEAYQKNKSQQTSGFNIENDILNKNILDTMIMMTTTTKRPYNVAAGVATAKDLYEKIGKIESTDGGGGQTLFQVTSNQQNINNILE